MEIGIYFTYINNGPGKVISNLISGFNNLQIKYKINSEGDYNIVLQDCQRLYSNLENCIIGPNICTLPIDNSVVMKYKYDKILVPSEWVKNLYKKWLPENKIEVWAAGIDTNIFIDYSNNSKKYDFLIYFKRRDQQDLFNIINFLDKKNKTYIIIEYGKYSEEQFLNAISNSKFGLIIDNCESQGIAIQEMLSCNLPLLVWDIKYWIDRGLEYQCSATSIPYWNGYCGEFFYDLKDLEEKYKTLIDKKYNPRQYIIENISIEKSTNRIMDLFKKNE